MRTIRTKCFETNSSSTHSVTIESKSKKKHDDSDILMDNVLIPKNLRFTSAYREDGRDGYTLHAETRDQKAALFLHHIKSIKNCYWGEDDVAEKAEKMFATACHYLMVHCKYANIETEFNYGFDGFDNEEKTYVNHILDASNMEVAVLNHVTSVILDDDRVIIDADNSY